MPLGKPMNRYCSSGLQVLPMALALAAGFSGTETAHAEGANVLSIGWAYIDPRSSSGPLTVSAIGGLPVDQPQAGTDVELKPANTLVMSYEYYWNEHLSTQAALGIPPTHELRGTGTLAPFGVLGEGQQWSPALIVKWHFFEADAAWRPYLGLGVNYTWYRRTKITNSAFVDAVYGPDATTQVSASSSWNAVYNAGLDLRIDSNWSLGVSLSYSPLKTRITVNANNTAIGLPVTVITDVQTKTLVGVVNLAYRF